MLGPLSAPSSPPETPAPTYKSPAFSTSTVPPIRIGKVRVPAVDQNVSLAEQGQQLADQVVDRRAGLDHHHDLARRLETGHQVFERMATGQLLAGVALEKIVDLADRAVEDGHLIPPALHVEHEVFAHHRQTHQTDVAFRHVFSVAEFQVLYETVNLETVIDFERGANREQRTEFRERKTSCTAR